MSGTKTVFEALHVFVAVGSLVLASCAAEEHCGELCWESARTLQVLEQALEKGLYRGQLVVGWEFARI